MQSGFYTFDDYITQLNNVRSMGGLMALTKMLPGVSGKVSDEQYFEMEKKQREGEKIISFMTEDERKNPELLAPTVSENEPYYVGFIRVKLTIFVYQNIC